MKTLITLMLLLTVIAVLAFSVVNSHNIQINYYAGSMQLPLALLLVITLTLGFVLGIAAMSLRLLHGQWEISKLRKQIKQLESISIAASKAEVPLQRV
ncbi:MAG: LapA family protein [Gammaproteobacteria bacterium]|nr:LapA family protein [Gammaproteobacteria bacterium]